MVVTGRVKRLRACLAGVEENLIQVWCAEDTSDSSSEEDEDGDGDEDGEEPESNRLASNSRPPSVRQISARRIKDERCHSRGSDNTSENSDSNAWGGIAASIVVAQHNGQAGACDYHMRYSQHVNEPTALMQPISPAYSLAPTIPAFPFSARSSPPTTSIPFTGH